MIVSVYLRSWTWSQKLADADVKHLTALDLAASMASNSWKKYLTHVFPHSFNTIRNFLGCCMAEGKNDAADDSDDEKDDKVIPFHLNLDHVQEALNHTRIDHHHHRHIFLYGDFTKEKFWKFERVWICDFGMVLNCLALHECIFLSQFCKEKIIST